MLQNEDAIVQRLDRLERENCRLKLAGAAALLALATLVIMGVSRPAPDVLTAQKFVLVDAAGRVRAQLWMGHSGNHPQLGLYHARNLSMARLTAGSGGFGPWLELDDAAGWPRALLTLGKGNDPHLGLFEPAGKAGAVLFGRGPFGPSFRLHDASGYETDMGAREAAASAAGGAQRTSAASIVMLGSDKERRVHLIPAPWRRHSCLRSASAAASPGRRRSRCALLARIGCGGDTPKQCSS